MAADIHGSVRTTSQIRAERQSLRGDPPLGCPLGPEPKTVAKWQKRATTTYWPMGPSRPRSSVQSETEELIVLALRRHTLLSQDDDPQALA